MTALAVCRRPRLAWVAVEPTPYHMPVFAHIRRQRRTEIEFFFCTRQLDQPWNLDEYDGLIAPQSSDRSYRLGRHFLNPSILRAIRAGRWDAIVFSGYAHFTMQLGIVHCLRHRIPFLLQSDTHLLRPRSWIKRAAKRALLFPFLRRASAAIGWGKAQADYFRSIGIPADRIFSMPLTPHLPLLAEQARTADRQQERRALGIPVDAVVGVFVGRLAPVKGLRLLLEGLARIEPAYRPHLLIVGDGPQRAELENIVREQQLQVIFAGFQQNQALGRFYGLADFFVLPSTEEPWGVVVAEAMACGLPALLSRCVGAGYDLLLPGQTGDVVPDQHPSAWANALRQYVTNRQRLPILGEAARNAVAGLTCEDSVQQFHRAVELALSTATRLKPTRQRCPCPLKTPDSANGDPT